MNTALLYVNVKMKSVTQMCVYAKDKMHGESRDINVAKPVEDIAMTHIEDIKILDDIELEDIVGGAAKKKAARKKVAKKKVAKKKVGFSVATNEQSGNTKLYNDNAIESNKNLS